MNTNVLPPLLRLLCTAALSTTLACGGEAIVGDDQDTPDLDASVESLRCELESSGNGVLKLRGNFERRVSPFIWITVGGKITSFAGPSQSISFRPSTLSLGDEGAVHEVGTYDVSDPNYNWVFSEYEPGDPECETTPCQGFHALSGSFEVTEHDALYRAEFVFSDLHEIDSGGGVGAPMAGSVTGCLVVEAP